MPLFVAGLFKDRGQAERVIRALLDTGVPSSEISLAVREKAEEDVASRDEWGADETQFGDLAVHSAWERLGWQGGARPPFKDKVAPQVEMGFVAAGPLAIAIGGAQLGACSGGLKGAMTNFGFQHEMARTWYDRLVDGQAWVCVRTAESQGDRVRQIFDRHEPDLRADSYRHW